MPDPRPQFAPTASWSVLRRRAELLQRVRRFFDERDFLEVETPLLSKESVVDVHLEPFSVETATASGSERRWLQTSPELAMKRMLAAGGTAIYQVTRSFRQGEAGPLHNPEFTILEWYKTGDDMRAGMQLLSDFSSTLLDTDAADTMEYEAAFNEHASINPRSASLDALRTRAADAGYESATDASRDDCLEFIFSEFVSPKLGASRPVIVYHFPASQAALAKLSADRPQCAERFELFYRGIELANGYHELTDSKEWQQRAIIANQERARRHREVIPEASAFISAMEHGLPASSGTAVGFDRLVLLATGAKSLEEIMAFPWHLA